MGKARPPKRKTSRSRTKDDKRAREDVARLPTNPDEVHDAGHPGGLPALDAKTDWEAEHDTWWRHE